MNTTTNDINKTHTIKEDLLSSYAKKLAACPVGEHAMKPGAGEALSTLTTLAAQFQTQLVDLFGLFDCEDPKGQNVDEVISLATAALLLNLPKNMKFSRVSGVLTAVTLMLARAYDVKEEDLIKTAQMQVDIVNNAGSARKERDDFIDQFVASIFGGVRPEAYGESSSAVMGRPYPHQQRVMDMLSQRATVFSEATLPFVRVPRTPVVDIDFASAEQRIMAQFLAGEPVVTGDVIAEASRRVIVKLKARGVEAEDHGHGVVAIVGGSLSKTHDIAAVLLPSIVEEVSKELGVTFKSAELQVRGSHRLDASV